MATQSRRCLNFHSSLLYFTLSDPAVKKAQNSDSWSPILNIEPEFINVLLAKEFISQFCVIPNNEQEFLNFAVTIESISPFNVLSYRITEPRFVKFF